MSASFLSCHSTFLQQVDCLRISTSISITISTANTAAGERPSMIIDPFAQLATLVVATATLQDQVAGMHPRTPAAPTTSFVRTPALRGKTDLLNFVKTADRNVYKDGMSPVLSRDDCFDATAKQLMPFINALNKRATDMGCNDATNPQQITLFDIPHHGATVQINLMTSYYQCPYN
jgi:hypothetical protein